jgi:chromosome segregation ATPase
VLLAEAGLTSHGDDCSLCHPGSIHPAQQEEVARVTDPKYTEDQHVALVSAAVERETASLASANGELETQVASLQSDVTALQTKVDVLEAEKAAALQAIEEKQAEFDAFKDALEAEKALAQAKVDRVARVKAAAPSLTDEYLSDEARQTRWAGMSEDAFEALIDSLTETAKAAPAVEQADDKTDTKTAARETAAFTGGKDVSAPKTGGTRLRDLFAATGYGPTN